MRSKPDQYGKGTAFLGSSSSSATTRHKKNSLLLSQVTASERAQFDERLHDRIQRLQKSDPFGLTNVTKAARNNAPTRETVAWDCEDPFNYDRTMSPDPFEL